MTSYYFPIKCILGQYACSYFFEHTINGSLFFINIVGVYITCYLSSVKLIFDSNLALRNIIDLF